MNLTIEMICKDCSINNCKNHTPFILFADKITGLQLEVKCGCKYCGRNK